MLDREREALLKERSKLRLTELEARTHEEVWALKVAQAEEDTAEARTDAERTAEEAGRQRETFQKTLRALQAALDQKDEALRESEESNAVLRSELVDAASKFGAEKASIEERLREAETAAEVRREEAARAEREAEEARRRLDRRTKEKKRLSREVSAMQKEVQDVYRNNERGIKVARILDHIDNID